MSTLICRLTDALHRVYPAAAPPPQVPLLVRAARGERAALQAVVYNPTTQAAAVSTAVAPLDGIAARVRKIGWVPIPQLTTDTPAEELEGVGCVPGWVPDPLFDEIAAVAGPLSSAAFWITLEIAADCAPGAHTVRVRISHGETQAAELEATLVVSARTVAPRRGLPVTHWFYADAICDWHGLVPYEERFWPLARAYMANLAAHGNTCQYIPLFTPPLDGVKRPQQLLKVGPDGPGRYTFDFREVRRFARLALEAGARQLEWSHLFTQWGAEHAIRVYADNADPGSLLWPPDTPATDSVYRGFLAQFLPAFHDFLVAEQLLERSLFHLSDEPHGDRHLENYRRAREMLRELAPWMRVLDALSDVRFAQQGLTDTPVAIISAARDFAAAGVPCWTYFCCGPRGRYVNRFVDTPLPKLRMLGWLLYRLRAEGFLHWGYNYWYKRQSQRLIDPFRELAAEAWPEWAYGDPFVVYPGPEGPLDSVRWEVFAASLGDYALLENAGVDPDDELLRPLKDYDDFPQSAAWIEQTRARLLA